MTEVEVRRLEGSTFMAKGPSSHWVVMDSTPKNYGQDGAAQPMEMVLFAMGGCSGIDIDLILRKMSVEMDDFRLKISGEQAETEPRIYTKIHVEYHFWGTDLPLAKLKKAAQLTDEKYCPVTNMLNKVAEVTTEVIVHKPGEAG